MYCIECVSLSVHVCGVSLSVHACGVSLSVHACGVSLSVHACGVSLSVHACGVSLSVHGSMCHLCPCVFHPYVYTYMLMSMWMYNTG